MSGQTRSGLYLFPPFNSLSACKNVSATARRLGMHRRTLQRKLSRSPYGA
ncbi:MAG: helix-turn-helix domain-containing protein [Gammaproteobacteria bacterium]